MCSTDLIDRNLRDLRFKPERRLSEQATGELRSLIGAKQDAIAAPVTTRRERKARRLAIRRLNDAMQPWVRVANEDLQTERVETLRRLRSNKIVRSREFSFVLHSREKLRDRMLKVCWPGSGEPENSSSNGPTEPP